MTKPFRTFSRMAQASIVATLLLVVALSPASRAQGVVADLTTHDIAVTADFSGTRVVLFGSLVGTVDPEDHTHSDIVIEVIGPTRPVQVRRKVQIGGVWVNDAGERVPRAPGYYAVVSNRNLFDIAPRETFARLGIGLEGLKTQFARESQIFEERDVGSYLDALVRIQRSRGLYIENPEGARFVGSYLFRAEIDLGANVPLGSYDILVYLFRDNELSGRHQTQLTIEKQGWGRLIYAVAYEQPLLYGILCVVVAAIAGMGAAYLVPRR